MPRRPVNILTFVVKEHAAYYRCDTIRNRDLSLHTLRANRRSNTALKNRGRTVLSGHVEDDGTEIGDPRGWFSFRLIGDGDRLEQL